MAFDPLDTTRGEEELRLNALAELNRQSVERQKHLERIRGELSAAKELSVREYRELALRVDYLASRLNDLSDRVAYDDAKFAAVLTTVERLQTAVAVILTQPAGRATETDQ
jgi:hypothetical protein